MCKFLTTATISDLKVYSFQITKKQATSVHVWLCYDMKSTM